MNKRRIDGWVIYLSYKCLFTKKNWSGNSLCVCVCSIIYLRCNCFLVCLIWYWYSHLLSNHQDFILFHSTLLVGIPYWMSLKKFFFFFWSKFWLKLKAVYFIIFWINFKNIHTTWSYISNKQSKVLKFIESIKYFLYVV